MNFKPSNLKVIVCILVIIALDLILALILRCVPYNLKIPTNSCTSFLVMVFSKEIILFSFIIGIIAYFVISLFQKPANKIINKTK